MYIQHNAARLVERDAVDAAVLDLTPLGGISGLQRVAATLEAGIVPLAHHCAFDLGVRTAAIVHAVRGIPGVSLPMDSVYPAWESDVLETPPETVDGAIVMLEGPGLGVDVDRDLLTRYAVEG